MCLWLGEPEKDGIRDGKLGFRVIFQEPLCCVCFWEMCGLVLLWEVMRHWLMRPLQDVFFLLFYLNYFVCFCSCFISFFQKLIYIIEYTIITVQDSELRRVLLLQFFICKNSKYKLNDESGFKRK